MEEKEPLASAKKSGGEFRLDICVSFAIIAMAFSVFNISVSTDTGIGFGIGIISAFAMGAGGLYTVFAVAWDILFIGATLFVLAATIIRRNDGKQASRLIVGGLVFCLGIPVLDIIFVLIAQAGGLQSFSLIELMIIASYGSVMNLIMQFLIYGCALVVCLIAIKTRNAKVAIIGLVIAAILALITLVCGLQPFAYSVGGMTLFGQTVPRITTYYLSEFASMVCMWVAISIFMAKEMNTDEKTDEN